VEVRYQSRSTQADIAEESSLKCSVIFVWDTLATLRIEYSTIWRAKWTWLKAFFLLNRYGSLVWSIGTCVTQLTPMSHGKSNWPILVVLLETEIVEFDSDSYVQTSLLDSTRRDRLYTSSGP